jgi:hypothetical protein
VLTKWFEDPLRPTRDLDFLGFGSDDQDGIISIFQEICAASFEDGVIFDASSVKIDRIREELDYGGLRITANATVDGARIRIVIDIAFGDAVEPGLEEIDLPILLDFPSPRLRLCAGDCHCGEVPGDGLAGTEQQQDERPLRCLDLVAHDRIQRRQTRACDRSHLYPAQNGNPLGLA